MPRARKTVRNRWRAVHTRASWWARGCGGRTLGGRSPVAGGATPHANDAKKSQLCFRSRLTLSFCFFFNNNAPCGPLDTPHTQAHSTQTMPPKSRLTVAQLKAELDKLGVPYDAKAKKAVLVDLLEKVREGVAWRVSFFWTRAAGWTGAGGGEAVESAAARGPNACQRAPPVLQPPGSAGLQGALAAGAAPNAT